MHENSGQAVVQDDISNASKQYAKAHLKDFAKAALAYQLFNF
jgi:hypothetical protein